MSVREVHSTLRKVLIQVHKEYMATGGEMELYCHEPPDTGPPIRIPFEQVKRLWKYLGLSIERQ